MSNEKEKEVATTPNEVAAQAQQKRKARFDAAEFGLCECQAGSVQLQSVTDHTAIMTLPIAVTGLSEKTKVDDKVTLNGYEGEYIVLDIQHYPK